ncbi:MAG: chromosomal replication initiator DnaA [Phenylobacterium sp.]|jgi:chromosomal replication initiation ATPase DnaA|uniref:chromosomal replication initiator DnaA n=1 Tax=Phenylobacterium sp. TaxID=1871053 RepID=UPI002A368444|nr:chromosomal replication initiator DnaA [Phenylobacterium sp.]
MAQQLRLTLKRRMTRRREDFAVGPSNAAAVAALDAWPAWHGGCLVLVGPEGVGKSHLAQAWAEKAGAVCLDRAAPDVAAAAGRPVLVENVDRGIDEEALFHLINMAGREGGGLLLTARTPPAGWPAALPDLRSRLNALPVALIEEPDDTVLEAVLRRLFAERAIRPSDDIYPYLLRRMPRSAIHARELVRLLDEAADERQRSVSRALAREILGEGADNLDLFD